MNNGTDHTLLCWSFKSIPGCLTVQGHCCMPQPCTLAHFNCTWAFSLPEHFLEHLFDRNFEKRPEPPGTALRRSSFIVEMFYGGQFCQKRPHHLSLPVITRLPCSRTLIKLQKHSGFRSTKGLRWRVWKLTESGLGKTKYWSSLAMPLCKDKFPFASAHRHCPGSSREGLGRSISVKQVTAGYLI